MDRLIREIEDLLTKELFQAYHEERGGHTIYRHIGVSHEELKERLRHVPYVKDQLIVMSRFHGDIDEVIKLVHDCLLNNMAAIKQWLGEDSLLELSCNFSKPIGDAVVKGTDWNTLFPVSNLWVVIAPSDRRDRIFKIITAYPVFNLDETDEAWDAVDEWSDHVHKDI